MRTVIPVRSVVVLPPSIIHIISGTAALQNTMPGTLNTAPKATFRIVAWFKVHGPSHAGKVNEQ
jgi:hypothetical protein